MKEVRNADTSATLNVQITGELPVPVAPPLGSDAPWRLRLRRSQDSGTADTTERAAVRVGAGALLHSLAASAAGACGTCGWPPSAQPGLSRAGAVRLLLGPWPSRLGSFSFPSLHFL